ncbi:16S rRNA (cytidine(1402)-2'-O)-methyltransferase [Senegalia massiliensis]|uniref:16S rRNA (cytidine(1402)-2'-O)-methyltransferase n=1 Tax=Senegalia massiliensis TaxID=1720316 RepID=UPI00102F9BF0|nr:16S rRNA (cytidine(1402)-2'-O)-methyltransferase [Senegalia massiliensis]
MSTVGKLFICPTPIGNLEDITIRTLNTLKSVDLIAAEDTRHTLKLLNHFDIKKPLISYHEHNKKEKSEVLIEKLYDGDNIALVSDAGMPGISDPGSDMVKKSIDNGIEVDVLPGATASILGLILSGLSTEKFVFEGFLSSKQKERIERLTELKLEYRTIIFYESPHRLKDMLEDLLEILGNRNISVARELTKKYQEVIRSDIREALDRFKKQSPKGEFVIVVEGVDKEDIKDIEDDLWASLTIKEHILEYMKKGYSKKESVKKVSKERNIPKREVYKESIDL